MSTINEVQGIADRSADRIIALGQLLATQLAINAACRGDKGPEHLALSLTILLPLLEQDSTRQLNEILADWKARVAVTEAREGATRGEG